MFSVVAFVGVLALLAPGAAGGTKQETERYVQELIRQLGNKDTGWRIIAARELSRVKPDAAQPALPALVKALDDPDRHVRVEVAGALCRLGHQADRTAALMLAALKDKDKDLHFRGHFVVRDGPGPRSTAAMPVFVKALADPDAAVRADVAWALAAIGPGAKDVLPALCKVLDDPDKKVRVGAAFALSRAGDLKTGLAVLIAALKERDAAVLEDTAQALHTLGAAAKPAVPALVALVEAQQEPAFGHACFALHGIGPEARAAIPALIAALRNPPPMLKKQPPGYCGPPHALAGIGKDAIVPLIALLKDADFNIRGRAAWRWCPTARTPCRLWSPPGRATTNCCATTPGGRCWKSARTPCNRSSMPCRTRTIACRPRTG